MLNFIASFSKGVVRRELWARATRRVDDVEKLWQPSLYACLCSKHFTADMFDCSGQTVRLRDGAVPTEFDFPEQLTVTYQCHKLNVTFKGIFLFCIFSLHFIFDVEN